MRQHDKRRLARARIIVEIRMTMEEVPDHCPEEAAEVWSEEVNRMADRLARIYGVTDADLDEADRLLCEEQV